MKSATLSTRGTIKLPAAIRKKYGLTPGRKVKFEETENGIIITPLFTKEEIKANIGFLGLKGKLLKALMREKKLECEL